MSLQHEDEYSYSSSDDSVCFGPYTMEEAKRDAKKGKPRQIDQRHSSVFRHYDSSNAIDTITAHFGEATNVSSNPSEYLTPNETVPTENDKNSDFLEKLSKVINEPVSGSTSYNTAFDQTNVRENDNSHQEESVITISDDSSSQLNSSGYEFITQEDTNESRSPVAIHMENDCQNLLADAISDEYRHDEVAIKHEVDSNNSSLIIENDAQDCDLSYLRDGDEVLNYERDNSSDSFNLSDPRLFIEDQQSSSSYSNISDEVSNQEVARQNSDAEYSKDTSLVIENESHGSSSSRSGVSDESSDCRVVDQKETSHSSNREEVDCQSVVNKENYLDDLDIISPTPQRENEQAYFGYKQLSKITEKTEFTTCSDRSASTTDVSENISEIKESPATSPIQIPPINLNQFDDSCDFDDTLEEMNRFLEQGAEYVMPTKTIEASKMQQSMLEEDKHTPKNIFSPISGSFMNDSSQDNLALRNRTPSKEAMQENVNKCYSAGKVTKPTVEVKGPKTVAKSKFRHVESKIKPPSVYGKTLFTKTTPTSKPEAAFKLPTKPVKRIATPSKTLNPSLKNVVSPIGVYINNAPKYCPMIKVPQSKHHLKEQSNSSQAGPSSCKENIHATADFDLPPVIYKPAKTKLASEVREINLPGNIKKLIAPRALTKHEQRIEAADHNQSVDRRLLESDLSIDVSLQSNPDISILTNKQAYNIRKF